MATANFEDFYEVPNLNFDISKLKNDLDKILKLKKFNTPGVTHFGAIPLNQIPNDKSSIEGSNIRGKYWTIADETGKEVSRDVDIDESKYTQLIPEFENTYFAEVYKVLSKRFKLGRVRLLLKEPRSTLSWHKDPECRLHVPIITNKGCSMVIENVAKHYLQTVKFGLQITLNIIIFLMGVNRLEYTLWLVFLRVLLKTDGNY